MTASVFTLSVETTIHPAFQAPFHVGTDLVVAMQCAEDTYRNRVWFPGIGHVTIRSVAVMRDGRVVDCFDGDWASTLMDADLAEQEALAGHPLAGVRLSFLRTILVEAHKDGDAVAVRLIEAEIARRAARITTLDDRALRAAWAEADADGDKDRADAIWAVFVSRHSPDQQPINCHPEYYGGWYALRGEYDLDVRVANADDEVGAILWLLDLEADDQLPVDYGMAEERARHP